MRGMKQFLAGCLLFLVATPAWPTPPNDTPRSWDAVVLEPYGADLTLVADRAIFDLQLQGYLVMARRQANWTIPPAVTITNWANDLYVGYGVWVDNTHGSQSGLAGEAYPLTNAGLVARNNKMIVYAQAGYDTVNAIYASQSAGGYHISMTPAFIASRFYSWRTLVVNCACDGYVYAASWKNARCVESYIGTVTNAQVLLDLGNFVDRLNGDFGVDLRVVDLADDPTQFTLYGEGKTVLSPRLVFDDVGTTLDCRRRGVQINFDTPTDTEIKPNVALVARSPNFEAYPYWTIDGLGVTLISRATGTAMLELVPGDVLNFRDGVQSTGRIGLDADGRGPNRDGKLYVLDLTYVDTDPASSIVGYRVTREGGDVVVSWGARQEEQTRSYRVEYSADWFSPATLIAEVQRGSGAYRIIVPNGAEGIYWLREVELDGTVVDKESNPVEPMMPVVDDTVRVTAADRAIADSLAQAVSMKSRSLKAEAAQQYDIITERRFSCPANWLADFWELRGLPSRVVYLEDIGGTEGIKPYVDAHIEITSSLLYGGASVLKDVHGHDVWNDPAMYDTMGYGPKPNMPQNVNNAVIGLYYTVDPDSQKVGFPYWTRTWGSVLPYFDRNNDGKPNDGINFGVAPIADTTDAWGFNYKVAYAHAMEPQSTVSFWSYLRGGTNAEWNYDMALQDSLKRRLPMGVTDVTLRDWYLEPKSTQWRMQQSVAEMNSRRAIIIANSVYDDWLSIGKYLQKDQGFAMSSLQSNPYCPKAIFSQCGNSAYDLQDSLGTVLCRLLMNTPDKGAYLIWAPNRGSFAQCNFALFDTALALLYKNPNNPVNRPFSGIANEASCAVIDSYPQYADVVRSFILLGDPNLAIKVPAPPTVAVEEKAVAGRFDVAPNPVGNGATTVRFTIPVEGPVDLSVFDVAGRRVARLAEGTLKAGSHSVEWRAGQVPAGLYFVRLQAPFFTTGAKAVRLR